MVDEVGVIPLISTLSDAGVGVAGAAVEDEPLEAQPTVASTTKTAVREGSCAARVIG